MSTRVPSVPDVLQRSTQGLVELVLDPEEHAYRDAAVRNGGAPRRRWYDGIAVALGCLLIGLVLAVAWVRYDRAAPAAAQAHSRLVHRVRTAEGDVARLSRRADGVAARLDALRSAALPMDAPVLQRLERARLLAGQLPAEGPGVEVVLSEPAAEQAPTEVPGAGERTPVSGGHILGDRDVRSVVDQLWSDGADAVAVNGIRLTPESAIRFAGDAVLVDYRPIASPYTIQAIGDPDRLDTRFAASAVAGRYQTLASALGIGFRFGQQQRLQLPAAAGTPLRYSSPGAGGRH